MIYINYIPIFKKLFRDFRMLKNIYTQKKNKIRFSFIRNIKRKKQEIKIYQKIAVLLQILVSFRFDLLFSDLKQNFALIYVNQMMKLKLRIDLWNS